MFEMIEKKNVSVDIKSDEVTVVDIVKMKHLNELVMSVLKGRLTESKQFNSPI